VSDAPTNPLRSEIAIDLHQLGTFTVRPSFDFVKKVEALTERGLVKTVLKFQSKDIAITDIVMIVASAVHSQKGVPSHQLPTMDAIGDVICEYGFTSYLDTSIKLLTSVMAAGPTKGNE
jgi:hypothetical protein